MQDTTNHLTRRRFGQGGTALLGAIAVGAGATGTPAAAQQTDAVAPDVDSGGMAAILREVAAEHAQPAMAAAVVRGDRVTAKAAVGTTVAGAGRPVNLDSRFHIASVTKRITAVIIARLVRDGALDWHTELPDALPDMPMRADFRRTTVRDVLLHRSGTIAWSLTEDRPTVQRIWYDIPAEHPDPVEQRAAMTEYALSLPPINMPPPAETYTYQNVGYAMLGHIAEVITGRPYEQLLADHIFAPLGMSGSRVGGWPTSGGDDRQPRGHNPRELPGRPARPVDPDAPDLPAWLNPAGGVHCPIADFAAFVADQLRGTHGRGELLDAGGYDLLHTPQAHADLATMYPSMSLTGTVTLGYGCAFSDTEQGRITAGNGSGGTYFASFMVAPNARTAFAGFTNAGDGAAALQAVQQRVTGIG